MRALSYVVAATGAGLACLATTAFAQPVRPAAPAPAPAPAPAASAAPVARTPLFLIARADSLYLVIDSIAPRGHSWRVTRSDGRVIAEGLEPERTADRVIERLGPDLPLARRLTRADDAVTVLRRLLSERAVSYTGLLLSRHIAELTGRLAVDGAPGRTAGTTYRAELVRRADGAVRATFTATLRTTPSVAAPATALEAVPAIEGMKLTWRYPRYTGDAGDVVVGFLIERSTVGGDATWRPLVADPIVRDDSRTPSWLDADVTDGATYRYRVVPVFIGGFASAPGAAVTAVMRDRLPPLAPLDVAADVQDARVRVVWAMSPDADVDGYQVERRKGGSDSTWTRLTKLRVPAAMPEFVDSTVRGGTIYAWRVRAVDRAGNAGPWATPVTARAEEKTPPAAPRALKATLIPGRRAVYTWEAPPARDVAGYHVYRASTSGTTNGTSVRLTGTPVPTTTFVDSAAGGAGLLPGRTYRIDIVSVDSSANLSVPASLVLTVPDDEPPAAPRLARAQGRFGGNVTVTWTASPSLDVASYVVEALDATRKTLRTIGQAGVRGPRTAIDTAAADGVMLRYGVFAVDSAGNRSPAAIDSLAKRDEERPSAPRAIVAVRAASGVQLRWERVMSGDLAGYVIFRAASLSGRLEEIGRTAPGVHTFTDASAPASAYYAVRAVDASGNLSLPQGLATPVGGGK